MKQPLLPAFALLLPLVAACGSVDAGAGAGEGGPDSGPGDHTDDTDAAPGDHTDDADAAPLDPDHPAVVSVTPADGAAGVRAGANIVIVFDRAMDADSVEAAWSSELLPTDEVSFAWNAAGDTLTVNPDSPLPVAEGDGLDPDVVDPIAIAFAIGTGAMDADGHALASAFQAGFTTVRRMTAELPRYAPLTDSRTSSNASAPGTSDIEYAGDTNGNLGVRILVSFESPELPAGAEVVSATLSGEQTAASANIFNSLGGGLEAAHVRFAQLTSAYGAGSLGSTGVFTNSTADGTRSLAVTAAVQDDLADGADYSQFRLELPLATDSDGAYDTVQFDEASFGLEIVYLAD